MDNEKIAKELVVLAKELTAESKMRVNLVFADNEDAENFAEMYGLNARGKVVRGVVRIKDIQMINDDLDYVYGVKTVLKGSY